MEDSPDGGTAPEPSAAEPATCVEEGVPPPLDSEGVRPPPPSDESARAVDEHLLHQSAFFRALESMPDASQDYLAGLSLARVGELVAEFWRSKGERAAAAVPRQLEDRQRGAGTSWCEDTVQPTMTGREVESASRIQRAYRGHRDRRAFYRLVAELSAVGATAGGGGPVDSVYVQSANRSARKFWDAHFADRRPSHLEVLEAFDMWLGAGGVDGARLASQEYRLCTSMFVTVDLVGVSCCGA
jgi:hypothetical protein